MSVGDENLDVSAFFVFVDEESGPKIKKWVDAKNETLEGAVVVYDFKVHNYFSIFKEVFKRLLEKGIDVSCLSSFCSDVEDAPKFMADNEIARWKLLTQVFRGYDEITKLLLTMMDDPLRREVKDLLEDQEPLTDDVKIKISDFIKRDPVLSNFTKHIDKNDVDRFLNISRT